MLNVTGKNTQFCNSNDVNNLRKSKPRTKEKKFESYKKSFQDTKQRDKAHYKTNDLRSHKTKKYTQSYDSNQFNFKFKRRRKMDENVIKVSKGSPKKIRMMQEGKRDRGQMAVNFRSCKQNIWKKTPFKIDLSGDKTNEIIQRIKGRDQLRQNSKKKQTRVMDFEHPIFASHNTNSYK